MNKKRALNVIAIALLTCFATMSLFGCAQKQQKQEAAATGETRELKLSTFLPQNEVYSSTIQYWIDLVQERTNGRINITPYWGGTLGSIAEHLKLVSSGIVDMAVYPPLMFVSEMPFNALLNYAVAAGLSREQLIRVSQMLQFELPETSRLLDEEQRRYNVKFLAWQVLGPTGIIGKKSFNSIDDLKGAKVSAEGGHETVYKQLGWTPVYVDVPDLYDALSRGVVDYVSLPVSAIMANKLYEVGKCYREQRRFQLGLPIVVNRTVWDSLPADIQQVLLETSKEAASRSIKADEEAVEAAWKTMRQAGVDVGYLSVEDSVKIAEATRAVFLEDMWMEICNKSGFGKEGEILLSTWKQLLSSAK